jgi:hypothetical protein
MAPVELLLAIAHAAQPHRLTILRTISSEWRLDYDSLPWISCKFPLEFPLRFICRMVSDYCTLSINSILFTFCSFDDLIFWDIISSILLSSALFNFIFSHLIAVRLLFHYCQLFFNYWSIIVLILEMYYRYFSPTIG